MKKQAVKQTTGASKKVEVLPKIELAADEVTPGRHSRIRKTIQNQQEKAAVERHALD